MSELQQLKRVLRDVAELRAELERLRNCPSGSSQIRGLPAKVRDYLHQFDNLAGPIEEAILESARETIEALTRLNVELRKSLNSPLGPEI